MRKSVLIASAALLLAGCSSNSSTAAQSTAASTASPSASAEPEIEVKTGIEDVDQWGTYIANLVYSNGKLVAVDLDRIDDDGNSSKEKYDNYGIKKVSSIGEEWWQQVQDYEQYLVKNDGKVAETDSDGHATDKDLLSGATINLNDFGTAVKNAEDGVEPKTDKTTVKTAWKYDPQWGTYLANVIERDGKTVKILVDRVGNDNSIAREKYDDYGIKKVSSIGKDWWEQAEAYEDFVQKNGVDAVEYDKDGHPTNPDLMTGCTIDVRDFNATVKEAENK